MLIFFADHPETDKQYLFTDIVSGEVFSASIQQRVKKVRYSDVFNCKQFYFEVTMQLEDGTAVDFGELSRTVSEYEIGG